MKVEEKLVSIIGLGYVGLPLAIEFGKKYTTIGYDTSKLKILNYKKFIDPSKEITKSDFKKSKFLKFTNSINDLRTADYIIVCVPTPVKKNNTPDLLPLSKACKDIGKILKKGSIIIFEPTVYPGVTEEFCVPIIEKSSGLSWKKDFNVAYSPERINPGDKSKSITKITKVVSADSKKTLNKVNKLYSSIIDAGIFDASSIKVAETAKVIENVQRDLNIALVNELAIICHKMNVDTSEVLNAASTKWNFSKFSPGLVGGHCIGVDPYYLTYKAKLLNYNPKLMLAGRKLNESISNFIFKELLILVKKKFKNLNPIKLTVLGVTFKENCSDIRNSKVFDLLNLITKNSSNDFNIFVHDPLADKKEVLEFEGFQLSEWDQIPKSDIIILTVPHKKYLYENRKLVFQKLKNGGMFFDIKSAYDQKELLKKGFLTWTL